MRAARTALPSGEFGPGAASLHALLEKQAGPVVLTLNRTRPALNG